MSDNGSRTPTGHVAIPFNCPEGFSPQAHMTICVDPQFKQFYVNAPDDLVLTLKFLSELERYVHGLIHTKLMAEREATPEPNRIIVPGLKVVKP